MRLDRERGHEGLDRVGSFAGRFDHDIEQVVDAVGVVAGAADHRVGADRAREVDRRIALGGSRSSLPEPPTSRSSPRPPTRSLSPVPPKIRSLPLPPVMTSLTPCSPTMKLFGGARSRD